MKEQNNPRPTNPNSQKPNNQPSKQGQSQSNPRNHAPTQGFNKTQIKKERSYQHHVQKSLPPTNLLHRDRENQPDHNPDHQGAVEGRHHPSNPTLTRLNPDQPQEVTQSKPYGERMQEDPLPHMPFH